MKRLVLVLVGDHLPHHLQHCYLLLTNPALDHPQVGIFDLREQRLLSDLIAHLFTTLTETLNSSSVLIVPIPVVLLDLLFIHLIHLEATLPITLSHVSLHIGSGLAGFICFVGIKGVSVAIIPPRILILLIVGVNLGFVDNEIPRISSSSLFLEFSIILFIAPIFPIEVFALGLLFIGD